MKIIKIIQKYKKVGEQEIKAFVYKNFPQELINGLEYNDPTAMQRAVKLLGIEHKFSSDDLSVPRLEHEDD